MTEKELIVISLRQNLMIAGMISELGMSIAKANGNDALHDDIKMLGMRLHKITNEAIKGLKGE